MGLKAGLHLLQQTGKAVSKYTDDIVGLGVRKWTKPTNIDGLHLAQTPAAASFLGKTERNTPDFFDKNYG